MELPFVPTPAGWDAHRDLHTVVTVLLSGDRATAGRLIAEMRWPQLTIAAAVNEIVCLMDILAEHEHEPIRDLWQGYCTMFEESVSQRQQNPPPNPG